MNKPMNYPMHGTRTSARNILDFLLGFSGSLLVGNLGWVLFAQFDTTDLWSIFFTRVWRFAFAGLAVFIFTRKRAWISLGILTAVLLQTLEL